MRYRNIYNTISYYSSKFSTGLSVLYHHDNEVFPDSDYRVILPECFYNTVQIKWDFPIDISSA